MRRGRWRIAALILMGWSASAYGEDVVVRRLIDQLRSPTAAIRARAAIELGELGAAAKTAVPALATALADNNLNVRYCAGNALKGLGPESKGAVPALVAALKTFPGGSPELEGPERYYADVRSVAAEALGAIGPGAREAIPALKEAATDKSADVRAAATDAMKRIEAK
jgi:HEAT repeat protein